MKYIPSVTIDGDKVRRIREERGLTQLYIATVVEVTPDTVSRWENKRYPTIKKDNALKLANALEVPLEYILEKQEQKTEEEQADASFQTQDQIPAPEQAVCPDEHRYPSRQIIAAGLAGLLAVTLLLVWFIKPSTPNQAVGTVRFMPSHSLPGQPFPVLLTVETGDTKNLPFMLREYLPAGGTLIKSIPAFTALDNETRTGKWLITANEPAPGHFAFLVSSPREAKIGERLLFHGDLVPGAEKGNKIETTGSRIVELRAFHWADNNKDNKIDDNEILAAFRLYTDYRELGIDMKEIETIWAGQGYRWDESRHLMEIIKQ